MERKATYILLYFRDSGIHFSVSTSLEPGQSIQVTASYNYPAAFPFLEAMK